MAKETFIHFATSSALGHIVTVIITDVQMVRAGVSVT